MITIMQDNYNLGQSQTINIQGVATEGAVNLQLEQTTKYSPLLYSFTVRDIGQAIQYLAKNGTLQNGAQVIANTGYVGNIGGSTNGSVTNTVSVSVTGDYKLTFQYLSGDYDTILRVEVNGIDIGKNYLAYKTNSWNVSDYKVCSLKITLNSGTNTIKFFNNIPQYGPQLNTITLNQLKYDKIYLAQDVTLYGLAKIENGLIYNVCSILGYITLIANVPQSKYYNFLIRYINRGSIDRFCNMDDNQLTQQEIYNFPSTKSLNASNVLYRDTILYLNQGNNNIKIYNL